jgi:CRP-like cAMP-binding protein
VQTARKRQMSLPTNRPPPTEPTNRLLAALPPADRSRILPTLRTIPIKLKQVLHKPGEPIDRIYFPGGGFCSIVAVLQDGGMVEVATVGREGMLGLGAFMDGGDPWPSLTMVQGESDMCYAMTVDAFRAEMDQHGAFFALVMRYSQALTGFIMQSTACNAAHNVEQRLSRWLLHAHDRMGTDHFPLTQEFAAMMLGASRPTVTVVAGILQKAGLITYRHGQVTIVDREQLESASCECYQTATAVVANVTRTAASH